MEKSQSQVGPNGHQESVRKRKPKQYQKDMTAEEYADYQREQSRKRSANYRQRKREKLQAVQGMLDLQETVIKGPSIEEQIIMINAPNEPLFTEEPTTAPTSNWFQQVTFKGKWTQGLPKKNKIHSELLPPYPYPGEPIYPQFVPDNVIDYVDGTPASLDQILDWLTID